MRVCLIGLSAAVGFAALALGCSSGETVVPVEGKLLVGGSPLPVHPLADLGWVQVAFHRIGPDGKVSPDPHIAKVEPDGSFRVAGKEGSGIPPGRYKVVVRQYDPYPDDKLGDAYSLENSPIEKSVDGNAPLVIDLPAP